MKKYAEARARIFGHQNGHQSDETKTRERRNRGGRGRKPRTVSRSPTRSHAGKAKAHAGGTRASRGPVADDDPVAAPVVLMSLDEVPYNRNSYNVRQPGQAPAAGAAAGADAHAGQGHEEKRKRSARRGARPTIRRRGGRKNGGRGHEAHGNPPNQAPANEPRRAAEAPAQSPTISSSDFHRAQLASATVPLDPEGVTSPPSDPSGDAIYDISTGLKFGLSLERSASLDHTDPSLNDLGLDLGFPVDRPLAGLSNAPVSRTPPPGLGSDSDLGMGLDMGRKFELSLGTQSHSRSFPDLLAVMQEEAPGSAHSSKGNTAPGFGLGNGLDLGYTDPFEAPDRQRNSGGSARESADKPFQAQTAIEGACLGSLLQAEAEDDDGRTKAENGYSLFGGALFEIPSSSGSVVASSDGAALPKGHGLGFSHASSELPSLFPSEPPLEAAAAEYSPDTYGLG